MCTINWPQILALLALTASTLSSTALAEDPAATASPENSSAETEKRDAKTAESPALAKSSKTKLTRDEGESAEDTFEKKRFSLNVRNGDIQEVLRLVAERGGLNLRSESAVKGKVNVTLKNTTLAEALDQLAEENGLEYLIDGDRMTVKRIGVGFKRQGQFSGGSYSTRSPAASEGGPSISANVSSVASSSSASGVREFQLKYANASTMMGQIQPLVGKEDTVIVDELANSLIFQGSEVNYLKLAEVIKTLDRLPQQVLIEAQIVETSRNFLQAFGLNWGLTRDPTFNQTTSKLGVLTNLAGPQAATGAIRYAIGDWGGTPLDVRLSAAESNGDAKVISRPKVVTLNNTAANINSGISFNVKTLSTVATGAVMATGGVTSLNAGLQLAVTPTIMGKDLVKLMVRINNSQPDESQIVDGIPGIVNNSANTSVIVSEGRTAVIAGLVKNTGGRAVASVPFFANIPILGALFRNSNVSDRNNELVIFITPQIVTPQQDLKPDRGYGEPKLSAPSEASVGT